MKKLFSLTLFVSVIAMSCGNNTNAPDSSASETGMNEESTVITHKEINSEVIKTIANLSISGMTCSAGCGGKIQKDLKALEGVKGTKLDFEEERGENIVTVEYNPSEVSEQDLIKCVNGIGDGRYHVESAEVVNYKGLQSTGGSSAGISVNDSFGKVFYVFDLLRSISKLTEYSK